MKNQSYPNKNSGSSLGNRSSKPSVNQPKPSPGSSLSSWSRPLTQGISRTLQHLFGGSSESIQQQAFIRRIIREQRKESLFNMALQEIEFVVFDLETTGFSPYAGDEIISIGGVGVRGAEIDISSVFYTLVQPDKPVPLPIEELTGITTELAQQGVPLIEALENFLEFVGNRVLIVHGASHDKHFLNAALWKTTKVKLTHRVLDTMMIAKWLHPRDPFDLDSVLARFQVPVTKRHHALEDSMMTAELWVRMLHQIHSKHIITLGDLYAYLSRH